MVTNRRRNSIPYTEALPDPHTVADHPIPQIGESGYREPPCYKWDHPFYIPPEILEYMDKNDDIMFSLAQSQPPCWTRPSWGWVGFRLDYECSDEDWEKVKRRVRERYLFNEYSEAEKFRILWVEDRERFQGKGLAEVRKAFSEWLTARKIYPEKRYNMKLVPEWDCYETNFCLVGDRRSVLEILSDIATNPSPLPHIGDHNIKESVDTSIIILDQRPPETMPGANRAPAEDQYDEDFWRAEGVEINPNYKGYLRCSLDDTAFLWKEVLGDGDAQETIYGYARRADKRCKGVFKLWHCVD